MTASKIVTDHSKIIESYMCELWATRAFPDRPDIGRRCFQPFIDFNVAAAGQFDSGLLEANALLAGISIPNLVHVSLSPP